MVKARHRFSEEYPSSLEFDEASREREARGTKGAHGAVGRAWLVGTMEETAVSTSRERCFAGTPCVETMRMRQKATVEVRKVNSPGFKGRTRVHKAVLRSIV